VQNTTHQNSNRKVTTPSDCDLMEELLPFTVDFGVDTVVGIAVRKKISHKYENITTETQ